MSGTVTARSGLPTGGCGRNATGGIARRGQEYVPMFLLRKRTRKGKGSYTEKVPVQVTNFKRMSPKGDEYRLVHIPFTKQEVINRRRTRRTAVRPLYGEYLWADRSNLKPDDPAGGKLDALLPHDRQFHEQWVRRDKLEAIK